MRGPLHPGDGERGVTDLLDARGVTITPGARVVVVHGSGDRARPFLGTVKPCQYGFRGVGVAVTASRYPLIILDDYDALIFERPERVLVIEGAPDVDTD
jgi:hypothetical protein